MPEFDCGCGLTEQDRLNLLATAPVQPTDWRQVKANGEKCRTCGGVQKHLFMREVES